MWFGRGWGKGNGDVDDGEEGRRTARQTTARETKARQTTARETTAREREREGERPRENECKS